MRAGTPSARIGERPGRSRDRRGPIAEPRGGSREEGGAGRGCDAARGRRSRREHVAEREREREDQWPVPEPYATIKITKTDGTATGDVNEPLSIQPNDNNGIFRVVDCKLMYNLATSSLSGVGTYKVYAVINGVTATNPAVFDLK